MSTPMLEQFAAAINAPVPFFLAVIAVAVAIWKAMEWAYRQRLELWQTMHQAAVKDAEYAKEREAALDATLKNLSEKTKDYPEIEPTVATANSQFTKLREANTELFDTLNRFPDQRWGNLNLWMHTLAQAREREQSPKK